MQLNCDWTASALQLHYHWIPNELNNQLKKFTWTDLAWIEWNFIGSTCPELDWIEMDWMGRIGLDWVGLNCIEFNWCDLTWDWIELSWIETDSICSGTELIWTEMEFKCNCMKSDCNWIGLELSCNGLILDWIASNWNGVKLSWLDLTYVERYLMGLNWHALN